MFKTIGVFAHVDAGKTTLLEQILLNANTIKKAGRVDKQTTFMDYHSIEKKRGITVFSDQANIIYNDVTYQFIDTPGHVDFSSEMERTLSIIDMAILIISSVEGIESHTETIWNLLEKNNIPCLIVLNKLDRIGANFNETLLEISSNFSDHICVVTQTKKTEETFTVETLLSNKSVDESIIEFIADRDSEILDLYLQDQTISTKKLLNCFKNLFCDRKIFPCIGTSTLNNIGIKELISIIDIIAPASDESTDKLKAKVFKITHDNNIRLTHIKLLSGTLKVKDTITSYTNDNKVQEKINQIRLYNGSKYAAVQELNIGQIGTLTGIESLNIGDTIGEHLDPIIFTLIPTLQSKVIYDNNLNPKEILQIFNRLNDEDPTLFVKWIEELGEIHISVMGIIKLEILQYEVYNRFGIDIKFDTPEIIYKETINTSTTGFGHFEPLKHFAEVELSILPAHRDSGITFSSNCSVDILDIRWQRAVESNIRDACKKGILTGTALTDVEIQLIGGKSHVKHTSGGDFRQATFRAIRQGIEKVENTLLEPYYSFKITVSNELTGKVFTDILSMKGTYNAPLIKNDKTTITGRVPIATSLNYTSKLAAFSEGKGIISLKFDGYDICHNPEEIIEKIGYNKDTDPKYTSNSIFCSKGQAYTVKGSDI